MELLQLCLKRDEFKRFNSLKGKKKKNGFTEKEEEMPHHNTTEFSEHVMWAKVITEGIL